MFCWDITKILHSRHNDITWINVFVIPTVCIHVTIKQQLLKTNPHRSCFTLQDQPVGQNFKKSPPPSLYYNKLCFLGWNFFEFYLFLRCVGCPILEQSTYTTKMDFLCQTTKLQTFILKGCCEKSVDNPSSPKNYSKRDIRLSSV